MEGFTNMLMRRILFIMIMFMVMMNLFLMVIMTMKFMIILPIMIIMMMMMNFVKNFMLGIVELIDFGYYDKECNINKFDNKFIVNSFEVIIFLKNDLHVDLIKAINKSKFYKGLHDDLMVTAWHPKRVVDWCYDIEEKEIYNSLPDE